MWCSVQTSSYKNSQKMTILATTFISSFFVIITGLQNYENYHFITFLNCSQTSCSLMYQIQIRFTACIWIFHEKKSISLFFLNLYFWTFSLLFLMFFFNLLKWFFFFKKASWEKRATYAARTRVVHFLIIGNWRSRGKQTKKFHRNFLFPSFQRFYNYWNWYLKM